MIALSIVAPHGSNIAMGKKTLEIRSWKPEKLPLLNLLIVENSIFLTSSHSLDPNGKAVAIVDILEIHEWLPTEVEAACSTGWQPNYWAWQISNVRKIETAYTVTAERKIYNTEINLIDMCVSGTSN